MKLSSYFLKYAKKEKRNFIASSITFLALFISMQALLGFSTKEVQAIYFFNPGFREDCYYSLLGGGLGASIPEECVGRTWGVTTSEQDGGLIYKAKVNEPSVANPLGFMISSRVYLLPEAPATVPLPSTAPYSIVYNIKNPQSAYTDESGKIYPLVEAGSLKRNDPLEEQLHAMNFSWVGFVALIDPGDDSGSLCPYPVVLGHGEKLHSSFASGKTLNEQYQNGRKQIPSALYIGFLVPFLFELVISYGIISSLDRKAASEIFSLRLLGVSFWRCYFYLLFRRFAEAFAGFVLSFGFSFPVLCAVLPGFVPALLIGEGIAFLYVLLSVLISAGSYTRAAFYGKKKGGKHA